jgi:acyl transferase domain-containing protein
MIGHSIGEFVAACLAEVFSLEEALALVAARGQLMQTTPGGAMLAVPLSEHDVLPLLDPRLSLAVINAPSRCVIAGPTDAVEVLERRLEEKGVACRRLHTSHAFHSAMMGPILAPFVERVRQVNLKPPQLPYVSNVTGTWITAAEATDPEYWARHLRQTVRFADGLQTLAQEPHRVLLEVGPGQTLCALARQQPGWSPGQWALPTLHHPRDQQSDVAFLLKTLGQLWSAGLEIDWGGFYAGERRQRVPLPTYPFERKRHWIEPAREEERPSVPTGDNSVWASSTPVGQKEGSFDLEPAPANPTDGEESALVTALEQIIEQQLNVMAQQLEVFAADTGSDV